MPDIIGEVRKKYRKIMEPQKIKERHERIIKPRMDIPFKMWEKMTPQKVKELWEKGRLTEYV